MLGRLQRLNRFVDPGRVERAIAAAEKRTSGEIRVSVSPFFWGDVRRAAEHAFTRLGMERTRQRNGVLLFIVPSRRSFVVLGDRGIHERVGDETWNRVVDEMTPLFRQRDPTDSVLHGIAAVADILSLYFPAEPGVEANELPDSLDTGKN